MPSSEARLSHREWIVGRAVTLLSHYWREDDPVELTEAIGRDWADVLEGLPQQYIQRAVISFQQSARPGKYPPKPTPAAIYAIAKDMMPMPVVVRQQVDEPEPYGALSVPVEERRRISAEVMAENGYRPKTFGGDSDE